MINWYLQSGKKSDIVLSTRVRLARNLKEIPFTSKYNKQQAEEIIEIIEDRLGEIGYGLKLLKLKDMEDLTKMELVEKHLISPDFALNKTDIGAVLINEDESICIMINEEDHIRMQFFATGLDVETTMDLALEVDNKLSKIFNFAYNEKYGYLTACPTNVGTGLRTSVMVHLPALTATGNISKILEAIKNFGMSIRGIYGEGSNTQGNVYQISNQQSLGISEKDIAKNLRLITEKIIDQERMARKYLAKSNIELEDKVYRAYGILVNCKKISSEECRKLLSEVRLGTDLGIIKELDDLKVNKIELYTKPANLQKYVNKKLDAYARDIERAEVIKQIVFEK